jgi:two-component system, OmpR family, response regulator
MAKILIVEDDVKYAGGISDYLAAQAHTTDISSNLEEALFYLNTYRYEVLIVDWMLPDGDGPTLVSSLRSRGVNTPILMLTARETIDDKERGFCSGVDDYLIKDTDPKELTMRIGSLLRRPQAIQDNVLRLRGIEVDLNTRQVKKDGLPVHLLPKEFALLEFLLRYPNKTFSSEELMLSLWPSDTEATTQTVRSAINKLRTKLDSAGEPSLFLTKYKAGYMMNVHAEPNDQPLEN